MAALSEPSISIDVQAVARRPGLARALPQASLFGIKSSLADYVLDDRHSTAATMRPMALIRTKLGLVVPVESRGGAGGRRGERLHAPSFGPGLAAIVTRSGSAA